MAKLDQGYQRTRTANSGQARRGRGMTIDTYISRVKKAEVADLYVRTATEGILDVLGLGQSDDIAMKIRQGVRDGVGKNRMTKRDLGDAWTAANRDGRQAHRRRQQYEELEAADALMNALYSATRMRERVDLDDGDLLDDPAALVTGGDGWGEETTGRLEARKHVNVAIDNSGSTHMPETGFCSSAIAHVANNLMRVLFTAASAHPRVTYDGFSFNRHAQIHTGRVAQQMRAELVRRYFEGVVVQDPLRQDAIETNLSPLISALHQNEERMGLIGAPRLDIILTDGEFESEADADEAGEWQRRRGAGVTTYVLVLCPDEGLDQVALPHQFRVIPVDCITDDLGVKTVHDDILAQTLNRIVLAEMTRIEG